MAIIILPVCFIAIFINAGILMGPAASKKHLLICSALIFSFLIAGITELLNAFQLITFNAILAAWGVITIANIIHLYYKRKQARIFIGDIKRRVSNIYKGLTLAEKLLCYTILIILLLVFVQGVAYPPNNFDSMTYHMARIARWVSHRSIDPFPTHIIRQIYQPPFAEFVIMHFDVLNRGDYFSSSVQFIFLLFSLVILVCIVKRAGLSKRYQILAIALAVTIPEVILEASSTQNDLVECFFVLASYYFALKAIKSAALINYLFFGIAIGLCILTKGTAYIYLSPILLVFGVRLMIVLYRTKNYNYIWHTLIVILIVVCINALQCYRNYKVSYNIFGADKIELKSYSNDQMSPVLFLSNVIKNAGLHMGIIGTPRVGEFANKVIYKLHAMAGIDINSPKNNFGLTDYSSPLGGANHEDGAPNLFHFILMVIAIILTVVQYFKKKKNAGIILLLFILTLQVTLFCLYLKWQPWNTRLHIVFFMLSVPLICYAININSWFKKAVHYVALPVILFYAFVVVLHNSTRPYISVSGTKPYFNAGAMFSYPRYENYFANKPDDYQEYDSIVKTMHKMNYKNIGLLFGSNDFEYPLFTQCFSTEINPISLQVHNYTKKADKSTRAVDCIVSTNTNQPFIDYNGKRYYNQDGKNKYLYLYLISSPGI